MPKRISLDLRRRILAHVLDGGSRNGAARRFGVSVSFVVKLLERWDRTGSLEPLAIGGSVGKLAAHRDYLVSAVLAQGDITMPELAARLSSERGVQAAPASLSRFLRRAGFRYKKNATGGGTRTRGCSPAQA